MYLDPRIVGVVRSERERKSANDTSGWVGTVDDLVNLCHPKQRGFVTDPGRRVVALVGRGGGKTTGGLVRLQRRLLLTRGARCAFIATTRQHAKKLIWERLKEIADKAKISGRFQETELKFTVTKNNSQLHLVGADDMSEIEKLRGLPHHEVGIDEGATHKPMLLDHLIHRIIAPRLGDFGGCLWMIGTPGHMLSGPFYDATRPGTDIARLYDDRDDPAFADWKRWSLHKWTLQDGAEHIPAMQRLWVEALVEKEANGWSDDHPVWRREYMGEWAADDSDRVYRYNPHDEDGSALNQWDPPRDPKWTGEGVTFAKLPPGRWEFVYGLDFGWADAFALGVFAFKDNEKKLYHVGEVVRRGMFPRKVAELLIGEGLDSDRPGGVIGQTGWPIAMVADKKAGGAGIMAELQSTYGITIEPADQRAKFDSIELTNGDFMDGRIVVMKGSVLETQLLTNQWDIDEYGKLRERRDQPNDACDTLIYARRRAWHLLADEAPPIETVSPRSREGQASALEEEERRLIEGPNEFDDWLSDDYSESLWD